MGGAAIGAATGLALGPGCSSGTGARGTVAIDSGVLGVADGAAADDQTSPPGSDGGSPGSDASISSDSSVADSSDASSTTVDAGGSQDSGDGSDSTDSGDSGDGAATSDGSSLRDGAATDAASMPCTNACTNGQFCWLSSCVTLTALTAGDSFTCALTSASNAQCWGSGSFGALGNSDPNYQSSGVPVAVSLPSSGVAAIAGGSLHACAVTTAGAAFCWGDNVMGQLGDNAAEESTSVPVGVRGLSSGVAAIATRGNWSCALTTAGAVTCWGMYATASANVPVAVSGLSSGIATIAIGTNHGCVVTTGGAAECWGLGTSGQLGNGFTNTSATPVDVYGLSSGVKAISAGHAHTCALTTAGAVLCWGDNTDGQLGNGSTMQSPVPVQVSGLTSGVIAISAFNLHTCAVTSAGAVVCWGDNQYGELGSYTAMPLSEVPAAVEGLTSGFASVASGSMHTCALTIAGQAWCWGTDSYGQLGNALTAETLIPVVVKEP
jgi:alpha-tubulin suppressor-like RCC1 family protein